MRLWKLRLGCCLLLSIAAVRITKPAQRTKATTAGITDDTFEQCDLALPVPVKRIIAEYCIGTQQGGVCPLLVRALAWHRVIGDCDTDPSRFTMTMDSGNPNLMQLCFHDGPIEQSRDCAFNFATGECVTKEIQDADPDELFCHLTPLSMRWRSATFPAIVQQHVNSAAQALDTAGHHWGVIASSDRGCVGIVHAHGIVLFAGDTGAELMRWAPSRGFSFYRGTTRGEEWLCKIVTVPTPRAQKSRYELVALVKKEKTTLCTVDRYVQWDIDTKKKRQDIYLCESRVASLRGSRLLRSGILVAMYLGSSAMYPGSSGGNDMLIGCGPGSTGLYILRDVGNVLKELYKEGMCNVYVNQSGSHVLFYGGSRDGRSASGIYTLCATLLNFDPTSLYSGDGFSLQHIRFLRGYCLAAYDGMPVTLTDKGKKIFEQLPPDVRRNLQTTGPALDGCFDDQAVRVSKLPILQDLCLGKAEGKNREELLGKLLGL